MDILMMKINFYSAVARVLLKISKRIDIVAYRCINKWYETMTKHPRINRELLDSVYNDPLLNKILKEDK